MNEVAKSHASQILITVAAFVVVVAGMRAAGEILVPFLLAAFIAIICAPLLFWMQRRGLPTWLSLLIVIIGITVVGFLVAQLVGSSVKDFTKSLPVYETRMRQQTTAITAWIDKAGVDTSGLDLTEIFNPAAAMKIAAAGLDSLGKVLTNTFLIVMTVIFMLLEASGVPAKLKAIAGGAEGALSNYQKFFDNVKGYMVIKTLVSLGTGVVVAIMLAVIGVDYPVLWGLLAFLMNYIPNIGSIIAAIPAVLLAVIQLGLVSAGVAAAGYAVINIVMGSVIEPRFMGRGLGLSTLIVFLSLVFWGWVLGPVGMLLSVPLTITAKIALDSREETRWLSILLGPELIARQEMKKVDKTSSETDEENAGTEVNI
jgi:predicted PurR-regulated permease PerM